MSTLLESSVAVDDRFAKAHTDGGYIARFLEPWEGHGMRVRIRPGRGYENCPTCNQRFSQKAGLFCHGYAPQRVFIEVSQEGKPRVRLYKSPEGDSLQIESAKRIRDKIIDDIEKRIFEIKRFLPRDENRYLFLNYKQEYLDHLNARAQKGKISTGYFMDMKSVIKLHLSFFDNYDIAEIRKVLITRYVVEYDASDKRVGRAVNYLYRILRWAYENEDIEKIPSNMRLNADQKRPPAWLTRDQQETVIENIPIEHRPIYQFCIATGWRPAEVRGLQVGDIDFKQKVIIKRHSFDRDKLVDKLKAKTGRPYPLFDELEEIVKVAMGTRIGGYVFGYMDMKGKFRPYLATRFRKILTEAMAEADIKVKPYEFVRHSWANQAIEAGIQSDDIAKALGNSREMIDNNYAPERSAGQLAKIIKMKKLGGEK